MNARTRTTPTGSLPAPEGSMPVVCGDHAGIVRFTLNRMSGMGRPDALAALDALVAAANQLETMLDEAERERDEAQEALQTLAADHYFARAEAAEVERDRLVSAVRKVLDYEHHPSRGSLSDLRAVLAAVELVT